MNVVLFLFLKKTNFILSFTKAVFSITICKKNSLQNLYAQGHVTAIKPSQHRTVRNVEIRAVASPTPHAHLLNSRSHHPMIRRPILTRSSYPCPNKPPARRRSPCLVSRVCPQKPVQPSPSASVVISSKTKAVHTMSFTTPNKLRVSRHGSKKKEKDSDLDFGFMILV